VGVLEVEWGSPLHPTPSWELQLLPISLDRQLLVGLQLAEASGNIALEALILLWEEWNN
jgi:hypothetical protein